jgi:hypothetical protein
MAALLKTDDADRATGLRARLSAATSGGFDTAKSLKDAVKTDRTGSPA